MKKLIYILILLLAGCNDYNYKTNTSIKIKSVKKEEILNKKNLDEISKRIINVLSKRNFRCASGFENICNHNNPSGFTSNIAIDVRLDQAKNRIKIDVRGGAYYWFSPSKPTKRFRKEYEYWAEVTKIVCDTMLGYMCQYSVNNKIPL